MGFNAATFQFLAELADNNTVDWFHANRDRYLTTIRTPALTLIQEWNDAIPGYLGRPKPIGGALSPPNRDVRFNQDKTPYRTHIAIRMRHQSALPGAPGPTFLLWIDPAGSFLSAGVHAYSAESLRRIRARIQEQPEVWCAVRELGQLDDNDLATRTPPHNDPTIQHDLRRRHYTITRRIRKADVQRQSLAATVIHHSQEMRPFADFLADALYAPTLL